MLTLAGKVLDGRGDFTKRFQTYPDVFKRATGEDLFPGTLNVIVDVNVKPVAHFKILGLLIGEPNQDLWFEVCRINRLWAYRIRPVNLLDGSGGWGDNILEIACTAKLRDLNGFDSNNVEIDLFR